MLKMERCKRPLESVNTIFFDLDNTLIPTRKGDELACNEVTKILYEQYALPKNIASTVTNTFLENFRKCPHKPDVRIDKWRVSLWRQALTQRYECFAEKIYMTWLSLRYEYLAPGRSIIEMLKRLRRNGNYNLALITNGSSESQWEKITLLNLSSYFDLIVVSGDWPWEKPDINIFFKACDLLGVAPSECVMVGDKIETDIAGGIAAGLAITFLVNLNLKDDNRNQLTNQNQRYIKLDKVVDLLSHLPSTVLRRPIPVINEDENSLLSSSSAMYSSDKTSLSSHSLLSYSEEDSNNSNASDGS